MNPVKSPIIRQVLTCLELNESIGRLPVVLRSSQLPIIRSLEMERDLHTLYEWVNQSYAIPYWQMNGPFPEFKQACEEWLSNPATHSLVAFLNDKIVCQLDIYETTADDLRHFYPAAAGDMGIHLLMGPDERPEPRFAKKMLYLLISFLFQSPLVKRVVCEPDERNEPACRLLERLGFRMEKKLEMAHKTANLYILSRTQFEVSALVEY